MADIAERRNEFTASDELNTAATSRSRTTATVPSDIDTANDPVIANSQSVQAFGAFELERLPWERFLLQKFKALPYTGNHILREIG
jgi:hypothetical protein